MKDKLMMGVVAMTVLAALAYIPLINRLGYAYDDWYLMYSAGAYGPSVFERIFSVDRPMRALVMIPAYELFGSNPLYYNLSAYVFRLLGALTFFGILNLLWPDHKRTNTLAAALFITYPGFLSQPNGVDYQSHILGLASALLSIALTIQALLKQDRLPVLGLHVLAALTAVLYLGQMEWYIGFEVFRWACVFLLTIRQGGSLFEKIKRTLARAYPAVLGPGLFLVWRLFFFQSQRGATDVDFQFGQFFQYPLQTIYHWGIQAMQDLFDVLFSAWVIPLSQLTGYIQWWGGVLALAGISLMFFILFPRDSELPEAGPSDFKREAFLLGLVTAVGGLIPIAMVNRDVSFPYFSRYVLVSSVGVAILIAALISTLNNRILRQGVVAALFAVALLTHHANAVKYVQDSDTLKNFWWQVAWRVPQFEKDTTLIAVYPAGTIQEDYFIWGPASLIYYPERQNEKNIQPGLFAAIPNRDTVVKVLNRERQEYDKRKNIITYANYRNMVILTQPVGLGCMRVIDGLNPENSTADWDVIREMSPYSEIEHVLADEALHTPPELVFGPEPAHGWCYYYQKADLARQRKDWSAVIALHTEAAQLGFSPADPIEWMPFLQAYAQTSNVVRLQDLAPLITADSYVAGQACRNLRAIPDLPADSLALILSLFCTE